MPALAEPVALENAPSTLNLMAVRHRGGRRGNKAERGPGLPPKILGGNDNGKFTCGQWTAIGPRAGQCNGKIVIARRIGGGRMVNMIRRFWINCPADGCQVNIELGSRWEVVTLNYHLRIGAADRRRYLDRRRNDRSRNECRYYRR